LVTNTTVEYIPPGNLFGDAYNSNKDNYRLMYNLMDQTWNETFWNISSQGEAYAWYVGYGMLNKAFGQ